MRCILPCGLATAQSIIGFADDPTYFMDPKHADASIVWFTSGWVEYALPNYLLANQHLKQLRLSFELCSEAPGFNESWPSDIYFYINGKFLGYWTCPGILGKRKGR